MEKKVKKNLVGMYTMPKRSKGLTTDTARLRNSSGFQPCFFQKCIRNQQIKLKKKISDKKKTFRKVSICAKKNQHEQIY